MGRPRYWQRPANSPPGQSWPRRLTRRGFLAATGLAGSGLAAAALVGCGGSKRSNPASGTAASGSVTAGGTLRLPGFEAFVADTYDPHQTQFGPIYSSHSAVFSKLLRYENTQQGIIATDLALEMPEVIDGAEYVIRLRRGARFQRPSLALDRPPSDDERALDGRDLTADDVVFSISRQIDPDSPRKPFFYRSYQYEGVERIEALDDYTVRIVLREPLATFLHALADTNAFIVGRELVDDRDRIDREEAMIGSGPFVWDKLEALQESRFVRNPDWFGWGDPDAGRPYIDGYRSLFLADDVSLEAAFRGKRLDSALQVSNPEWVNEIREEFPEVQGQDVGFSVWLNSRLLTDKPPFQDFRVRRALHLVTDRQQMIDSIFRGRARLQGPISPVLENWALPAEELSGLPGYRSAREEREEDVKEARALYAQAGSPALTIVFGDQPSYVPDFAPQYAELLQQTLGAEVKTTTRSYVQISESLQRGDVEMTWQFDNGWIEPDDWLYPFFHSRGPKNSFHVNDPDLDAMLEAQRREFDVDRRRELVLDIQRYLLANVLARLDYVTPVNMWVAWPYYRNFRPGPFFGESYQLANAWLDSNDPSYQGRA